ncbi:MAG: hypothetical protein WBM86_28710 [Waterburya sp.]
MLIQDLEFVYRVNDAHDIAGAVGVSAKAGVKTSAGKGTAGASAYVRATGDISAAVGNTKVKVFAKPYYDVSYAVGHGAGYGVNRNGSYKIATDVGSSFYS